MSQIVTLETLIGCIPIMCLGTSRELMAKYEIMALAWQVGPFHLTLHSDKLRNEFYTKEQMP